MQYFHRKHNPRIWGQINIESLNVALEFDVPGRKEGSSNRNFASRMNTRGVYYFFGVGEGGLFEEGMTFKRGRRLFNLCKLC